MTKSTGVGRGVGGGQPTKFKTAYIERAFRYSLSGATDEDMAGYFGVTKSTLALWKKTYPKFSDAIARAKNEADGQVVMSLYKRALGYSHPELDIKQFQGEIIKTKLVKHYPPDTRAAEIWLRNRRPAEWREQSEVKITKNYEDMTDDELEAAVKARKDRISPDVG